MRASCGVVSTQAAGLTSRAVAAVDTKTKVVKQAMKSRNDFTDDIGTFPHEKADQWRDLAPSCRVPQGCSIHAG
jgi:hypothetical protein